MLANSIKKLVEQNHRQNVAHRRHLHQHPELSFKEYETSAYVQQQLSQIGIPYQAGIAGTGVVAYIKGKNPDSKTIALRADMDALPITEENDVAYRSKKVGVMHACGHDVHTANLLGVSKILNELKDEFSGTVKLIYQPAEERHPGGASIMIKEGVLENPKPTSIIGQHVHPILEAGVVGFREGMMMASCDEIFITVNGKGGHGAVPQNCIDPVLIACQTIINLQQIVSRFIDPTLPRLLTFGGIETIGSNAPNVIPNQVKISGTLRMMDEAWRFKVHEQIERIVKHTAEAFGGTANLDLRVGYPYLINDPALTARCRTAAQRYLGKENVVELPMRMTAEDFSYYSQQATGCFYRLGTGNTELGITSSVHTPTFDIDEEAMKIGVGLMAHLALTELST